MDPITIRLSAEELAFVFYRVGQSDEGKKLIELQFGDDISQDEFHARLISAGHALLARGLARIEKDDTVRLDDSLLWLARCLSQLNFTLRYSRLGIDGERFLSYHFSGDLIIEHAIEQNIVHHITEMRSVESVIDSGLAFFDLSRDAHLETPPVEIPLDLLNTIAHEEATTRVDKQLQQIGVPAEIRGKLGEDLVRSIYRGSILRVEYNDPAEPQAERGLLILHGRNNLWLLRPSVSESEQMVSIFVATAHLFRKEVAALLTDVASNYEMHS